MVKVIISAGHGFKSQKFDPGFVNVNLEPYKIKYCEHNLCKRIVDRIVDQTQNLNVFPVVSSGITKKAKAINEMGDKDDLFLEFHLNGSSNEQVDGYMTLYHPHSSRGKKVGRFFHDRVLEHLGRRNMGLRKGYYRLDPDRPILGILRKTRMPALILEPAFLSSQIASKELIDGFLIPDIAYAYSRTIWEWFQQQGGIYGTA